MQDAILKEKISLIQNCYVNGGHCRNKVLNRIFLKNPTESWALFVEGILHFRIQSDNELKSWQDLHQNFFQKTDNEAVEINKRKLFNFFWKMIPTRQFKYEGGAEMPDIPTIEGEFIPSEYLRFIRDELQDHLTSKQRQFLNIKINGLPTNMSPQAMSQMTKRIAARAEKIFKERYPMKSDIEIQRAREQAKIQGFLSTNPDTEAVIDFIVENVDEMQAIDEILYEKKLPIEYRKVVIKSFINGDERWVINTKAGQDLVSEILKHLKNFVDGVVEN